MNKILKLQLILTAVAVYSACHSIDVSPNSEALDAFVQECIDDATSIDRAVSCIPDPVLPDESSLRTVESIKESVLIEGVEFECTADRKKGNKNEADYSWLYGGAEDVLFTGNLVQGKHLMNGNLVPLNGERSGGTIVMQGVTFSGGSAFGTATGDTWDDVLDGGLSDSSDGTEGDDDYIDCSSVTGQASYSCDIAKVNLTNITEAQRLLESQEAAGTAANMFYEISTVNSSEHMLIQLGIAAEQESNSQMSSATDSASSQGDLGSDNSGGGKSGSFDFDFTLETTKKESITVMKFTQGYYSVVWQQKNSPSDYFDLSTTLLDDIRATIGPGNPAAYISSVTYGRSMYLFVISKEESSKIEVALDAAMSSGSTSGEANFEGCFDCSTLQESKIIAVVIGGSASAAAQAITSDPTEIVSAMQELIAEGAEFSAGSQPALPIAYTARWLATNEPAKMSLATDFTETECVPIDTNLRVAQPLEIAANLSEYFQDSAAVLTASRTGESFLYITGGTTNNSDDLITKYVFDPGGDYSANSVEVVSDTLPKDLSGHGAIILGGDLYLFGGVGNATSYRFDIDNSGTIDFSSSDPTTNLPSARHGFGLAATSNYVYLVGGGDKKIYFAELDSDVNPVLGSGTFTETTNRLAKPVSYGKAFIRSGVLYSIGSGFIQRATIGSSGEPGTFTNQTMTKSDGSTLDLERFGLYIDDDYIYTFGGEEGSGSTTDNIYFARFNDDGSVTSFSTNTKGLNSPRMGHITTYAAGHIYNISGRDSADGPVVTDAEVTGILPDDE